jgi:hypothetical protein
VGELRVAARRERLTFTLNGETLMIGTALLLTTLMSTTLMAMPAAFAGDAEKPVIMIGDATMAEDGTITINLHRTSDGIFVSGRKQYVPGDPHYQEVLDHIGGLKPGETKLVPAWPDKD